MSNFSGTGRSFLASSLWERLSLPRTSLRLRLVVAFLLVAVPAMLASAYVAARLISNTFEANVEQWLGETSRFLELEILEAQTEAQHVAGIIGDRLKTGDGPHAEFGSVVTRELEVLESVGYDLIAIYDGERGILFKSRDFQSETPLPLQAARGIFTITSDGKTYLMAGAVNEVSVGGKPYFVVVGTWIDENFLSGIKVVTSLDVRLYARAGDNFLPFLTTRADLPKVPPPPGILRRLRDDGRDVVYDKTSHRVTFRSIYAALRGADQSLAAIVYIGLDKGSFFDQISQWKLFTGIFLFGTFLSVLVGLWMSSRLVRPLRALTAGVRSVTAGDYRQRVVAQGGAEVAELATCFNAMAEQLNKMHALEEQLRRRDRLSALGEAAMVIAHEVRNPLGIIKTSTEVVRNRSQLGPAEERMLGYVIDEVRRIENLIRDFLDYAHPKPAIKAKVDLADVMHRVGSLAQPELLKRKVLLTTHSPDQPMIILGDLDQLHQACLNLILNAMDAMPDGGRIDVSFMRKAGELSVTVRDDGPGIAEGICERIFDPFFTTKAKGTGLGLAKVQTVVEAHGGAISVASEPGQGAAFTMTFPAASPSVAHSEPAP